MSLNLTVNPFMIGGSCFLDFRDPSTGVAPSGTYTITRTPTGGIPVTVVADDPINPLFLDLGDGLDANGNTITGPIPPGAYTYNVSAVIDGAPYAATETVTVGQLLSIIPDGMNDTVIRVLQGAFQSLKMPAGMQKPEVQSTMPIVGFPPLPFVMVNEELLQQTDVPIGQDVLDPDNDGMVTVAGYGRRVWRMNIMARNSPERDFIRDFLIGVFQTLAIDLFAPLGRNIRHRWQAESQTVAQADDTPGFYLADIMFVFEGNMNTGIAVNYGTIETITFDVMPDANPSAAIEVQVPLSSA
jgi:hypothetical protein